MPEGRRIASFLVPFTIRFSLGATLLFVLIGAMGNPGMTESSVLYDNEITSTLVDSVIASGLETGTTLEDRVEVTWTTDEPVTSTSSFQITRDGVLIHIASPAESIFEDLTAVPNVAYEYCVSIMEAGGTEALIGCDTGGRVIARPTGFEASDGLFENHILLTWSDRSEIEAGYNIYRNGGNALEFDGSDDYISTNGVTDLVGSFTFEFWAQRASIGTSDFVVNLETNPNGDPVDEDVEIGFNSSNQFTVGFGTNVLVTTDTYTDTDWHHWAVVYDDPNQRRFIYRDGVLVANDVSAVSSAPTGDLEFGRKADTGSPDSRGFFDGQIDEIRYWSSALTSDEVETLYTGILTGSETGLESYWPMDADAGTVAADVIGTRVGTLVNMDDIDWVASGLPFRRLQIGADLTSYIDVTAVSGFQSYTYNLAAFEDVDGDGAFTVGTDFESEQRTDDGWRAFLTPPGDVSATDGQFNDRVQITWNDQSDAEDSYNIYRDGGLIGTVLADVTVFEDLSPTTVHEYCVAGSVGGVESVQICDQGMAGGLPPPVNVIASNGEFDDRIVVSWNDESDTEEGFEVFRDDVLLATLDADAEEYNDFSAVQDVEYDYCVRAFSEADPLSPSFSDSVCAPSPGLRAVILDPTDLTASVDDFEDRVSLSWINPSTTAMLFMVYREGSLIEVLDFSMTSTIDTGIPSDTDLEYCVSAATVVAPGISSVQGQIAQVLDEMRRSDVVSQKTGGNVTTAEAKLNAVYGILGLGNATNFRDTTGFFESGQICDNGRRSILGPTDVDATDDEFESHVQITWTDNSAIETGYVIFRTPEGGSQEVVDTLSANRTTYGDYTGIPGTQYTYTLEAIDDFDGSQMESNAGIRTLDPPTNLVASDGTDEMIVALAWEDNSDAEVGYRIYRRRGTDPFVEIGTTGKNEPAFEDAVPDSLLGAVFDYEVVAFDDFGESEAAKDEGNTLIEAPANVNASDVYEDNVVIVWVDKSEIEENYILTRREVGTNSIGFSDTLAANATMFTDTPPTQGQEYEYCVTAVVETDGTQIESDALCDVGVRFLEGGGGGTPTGVTATRIGLIPLTSIIDNSAEVGASVAMDGSNALIGAPGADDLILVGKSSGRVARYTFDMNNVWTLQQQWNTDDEAADPTETRREYGFAVDLSGDYAVVGDPFKGNAQGGEFDIWKNDGGWSKVFTADQPVNSAGVDNTGYSVGIVDSFAVVGNNVFEQGSSNLPTGHGGAIICNVEAALSAGQTCIRGDGVPRLEDVLSATQQDENAEFGAAVDITRIADSLLYSIVGAPGNDLAYIFECNLNSTSCSDTADWTLDMTLNSRFSPNDRFGAAVAIGTRLAAVGAPGAEGFVLYELIDGEWEEQTIASPSTTAEEYGAAIAISDSTIIIGAPGEDIADFENAGAVYTTQWDSTLGLLTEAVRYDARVAERVIGNARFGASVAVSEAVGDGFYLVGAPGDLVLGNPFPFVGAVYSIPFGLEPPDDLILPSGVDLALPGGISASDGTAPDRIQIRWDDESDDEDGHLVFRSNAIGEIELLAEVSPNVEFFDDFEAAPGEAYTYCIAAFFDESQTELQCDIGWRPPNGTIAGRLASRQGAGTEDALVCLDPNPNRSLIFDGTGGYVEANVEAAIGEELDVFNDFTIEAWIRPQAVDGERDIVSKDSSFALSSSSGQLQLTLFDPGGTDEVFTSSSLGPLVTGTWYHVAVTMDENNNIVFFLDGVAESGFSANGFANTSGDTLTIGQRGDGSNFFKGEIDELRIWNIARPDSVIDTARFDVLEGEEENLVGYWGLDQGLRRVVPDLTESANHGILIDGVYLADDGAPLNVCGLTTDEGNFSISGIRYGESTEFDVTPMREGRGFEPSFKKITLTIESPVQNEVGFTDVTAFTVAGLVQYQDIVGTDTLSCAVPDVRIHASKGDVATDENVKTTSGADGSYAVALDPSTDPGDTWFIIPQFVDDENDEIVHAFSPANQELFVRSDTNEVNFVDLQRHILSGNFSGGDPESCGKDIGTAFIRIRTQDGCYDRTIEVDSGINNGAYSLELPPLEYLVEVDSIIDAPSEREEEIAAFFENLGTLEVDLTQGDVERNLIFRAPITLSIEGLDAPSCSGDEIAQVDEEGNPLRVLPVVPTIGEFEFVPLTIKVEEDYGGGETCAVDEGTVTIFDSIADRVEADSTLELENGEVNYTTVGASPNIFSGARIGGVDRSFQKPITVVAEVEGRDPLTLTEWVIVEGIRERAATFVSATTEEFPLLIVHDPPGSQSHAWLEQGTTMCNSISNMKLVGGGAGLDLDLRFGFNQEFVVTAFGVGTSIEGGGGFAIGGRAIAGQDVTSLQDGQPNREICVTTTEEFSTSTDPGWVGEDIHIGVALNLIFAIADVLEFEEAGSCRVELSETLAADLDESEPFETTYAYGKSHIGLSLIPELENLIRLAGGDATIEGEIEGNEETIRLQSALDNWEKQLDNSEDLIEEALANPDINRSFSGGAEFAFSEAVDTTTVTHFESTRIFVESEGHVGGVLTLFGHEQEIFAVFEVNAEWVTETEETETRSKTFGYLFQDDDTGDFISVDVARNPRYRTFVFGTQSGRTSNPCESDTQCRDNPILQVDPPVQFNVDPGDAASFDLTLINGSESNERRRYFLATVPETNLNNLGINVGGSPLSSPKPYLLDPGKAITVNMDTYASPGASDYEDVAVYMYPENELAIWTGDPRQSFPLSDSAFFSVFFESGGGNALATSLASGWNWFSINRRGGDLNTVLRDVPVSHGDIVKSQHAESRFDSTAGWQGNLKELVPGYGYRVWLQDPTIFRILGEAVKSADPIELTPGWNWVGYVPARRMPVGEAMSSLQDKLEAGDAVVGQNAFAQYVEGTGWIGTLKKMVPGESYAIYLDAGGELLYPEEPEKQGPSPPTVRETTVLGPEWKLSVEEYTASMTVVGEVLLNDVPIEQTTFKLAVYHEEEIRGTGEVHYIEELGQYLAFFMIYGSADEEEDLRIHVYDGEKDIVYEDVATIKYAAQKRLGHPGSPVQIDLANAGQAPELLDIPNEFALYPNYPNPFGEYTTIAYDLPKAAEVSMVVYDLLGRRVATVIDGEQAAGRHRLVFDGRRLASGLYMYRLEVDDTKHTGKMIIVR